MLVTVIVVVNSILAKCASYIASCTGCLSPYSCIFSLFTLSFQRNSTSSHRHIAVRTEVVEHYDGTICFFLSVASRTMDLRAVFQHDSRPKHNPPPS